MVAVGALVDRPLTSMIWLKKSKIKGVADLRGKTIATAGIPYQDAFLKTILARANLSPSDVKAVNVGFGLLPAIVGGSAQAMLGGFSNVEGVDLRDARQRPGRHPGRQARRPHLRRAGPRRPAQRLEEDPQAVRLFLAALARGTAAAVEDPEAATKARARSQPRPRTEADRGRGEGDAAAAEAEPARAALRLHGPGPVADFIGWMRDNGLITSLPSPSEVLSNAYLPGRIPE